MVQRCFLLHLSADAAGLKSHFEILGGEIVPNGDNQGTCLRLEVVCIDDVDFDSIVLQDLFRTFMKFQEDCGFPFLSPSTFAFVVLALHKLVKFVGLLLHLFGCGL